ncbi:OB-fold-containig protein [Moritella sp.]|uniref:OB-fold-containig protein n=1 Tax=Moritella sp. TaxID=78556 RepID=UPI0025E041E3|nr:OB-fold-containig protein [Moritella sp.]MCJ8351209.1 YqiJ family protein [Moritella sp.]
MFTFLLADMNLLYTLAISIVLLFLFLELLGLIVGISLLELLDNISPIDANSSLPITDGGVSNLLDWLCLTKLPMLVWLIIALTHFEIIGYSINYAVLTSLEWQPQLIFILPTTVFFTLIMTHFVGSALAQIIPNNETTAVSTSTFIGKAAKRQSGKNNNWDR